MSYTQLTQGERYHIQYLSRHCTVTEIAKQLNRHKSTISREIRRHRTQGQQYSAEKAQRQSRTIKQRKRQPYKLDSQLIQHIDTLIRRKLSPEQVCAYLRKHHQITLHHSNHLPLPSPRQKQRQHVVATSQNMQQTLPQTLRQHMDQRQSTQPCRHRENRPAIVDQKSRIGDWEADTIVGKGQKSALLTLVERGYPLHHHLQIG
ncbi:transposase%2C IS30 family [Neisseria meningitidis]|uniref:IS30 family transposase n=1 Tax=Neisseria meningitidis TaxID=487 RepID=UPI0005DF6EB6|nr:IS30 family transposase [Neisseria meningitidis]CKK15665.1 transposase%2C IS30 family [Neisseria meningitidis]